MARLATGARGLVLVSRGVSERPVVIVNPKSGAGLSERKWAGLVGPLTEGLGPFDTRFTESRGHAQVLASDEARAGRSLVVALGGDGTISEVANGLAGTGAQMGIIPRGTGGDFRRVADLPSDLNQAARHIHACTSRLIDLGRVTFTTDDGGTATRHFINEASFGLSAEVARRANESSKRLGAKTAFIGAMLRTLVSYDNVDLFISVDGAAPVRRTVLLGTVGNGRYFGGGMKICPGALLDDGLLDLVLVGDMGKFEVMTKFNRLYEGTHLSLHKVGHHACRRVEVRPVDPEARITVECDGETPGRLPATFEILPGALRLRY